MNKLYQTGDLFFSSMDSYLVLDYMGRSFAGYEHYAVLSSRGEVIFYHVLTEV
jgi:hypothetical protein